MVVKISMGAKTKKGFTLIEILLVIAAISILAAIVIVAINPAKQLAEARNAQRRSNVNTILNAIHQYAIDNDGDLPGPDTITTGACAAGAGEDLCIDGSPCTTGLDLSDVLTDEKYIVEFPIDPQQPTADGGGDEDEETGYAVTQSANGRVTVCAPLAEEGATIEVKR